SAGCQLSPPGGLGSDHPTLDLINKAHFYLLQYQQDEGLMFFLKKDTLYLLLYGMLEQVINYYSKLTKNNDH
ncbi:hypothetical protein ACJEJ9_02455, partial [Escherichia coli]